MTDLPLHVISETAKSITLGWTPPPDVEWYTFYVNGQRIANAPPADKNGAPKNKVTFGKPGVYRVVAAGPDHIGFWPPIAPPPAYGGLLPVRVGHSNGTVKNVASAAEFEQAAASANPNDIINATANINGAGTDPVLSRAGIQGSPITVTCNAGVKITGYSQWTIVGAYWRFLNLDLGYFRGQTKVTYSGTATAHHIEYDGCRIHHNAVTATSGAQGILIGSGSVHDIQIWNSRIHDNGSESGYDQGIYWAYNTGTGSVIANCAIYDNQYYQLQIYPSAPNLLITCCTIDGGMLNQIYPGGGVVVGSSGTIGTRDTRMVGCIISNAPGSDAYHIEQPSVGNLVQDSIQYNNAGGGWGSAGQGVTYTNAITGDPLYQDRAARDYRLQPGSPAIGLIRPERYGYVPPVDITGKQRVTADAGAYAT